MATANHLVARRSRRRDDSGIALIMVSLIGLVLMAIVAISTTNSLADLNSATR